MSAIEELRTMSLALDCTPLVLFWDGGDSVVMTANEILTDMATGIFTQKQLEQHATITKNEG